MGIFSFLDPVLNLIFGPLLKMTPFWAILNISFIISLIITLVYKWMTDQNLMKQLKDEIKEFQKEMKELRHKPEEAMKIQKKAMQTNMKYMMQSMKPTLITFIPIILIFGWLQGHMAFEPIMPGQEFSVDLFFDGVDNGFVELKVPEGLEIIGDAKQQIAANGASFALKGIEGSYFLEFIYNDKSYTKDVLITTERAYKSPEKRFDKEPINLIRVNNKQIKIMDLFGWKIGWLGGYIIFSIIFSMLLRKLLKIY